MSAISPPPGAIAKIVFLEDDEVFADQICRELEALNYEVIHFGTGQSCLSHMALHDADLCVFDWILPDMPGTEVMSRLRKINRMSPVIFMTGNDAESDVAEVLISGADDYIVKPPNIRVLHARIEALLRRIRQLKPPVHKEVLGHLTIDYQNKVIFQNNSPVDLTGTEAILAFDLFMNRGQVVTRQHLYELMGVESLAIDTRRLDVHISHLRRKLALNAFNGWRLVSIYQRGYRLEFINEG
jgi:DNA-binding response OmpR family regulator